MIGAKQLKVAGHFVVEIHVVAERHRRRMFRRHRRCLTGQVCLSIARFRPVERTGRAANLCEDLAQIEVGEFGVYERIR